MSIEDVKTLIRNHFDELANLNNLDIAQNDKAVLPNECRATSPDGAHTIHSSGIVIWRIQDRQIVERWVYLETPKIIEQAG